jgi:hypothetical protein
MSPVPEDRSTADPQVEPGREEQGGGGNDHDDDGDAGTIYGEPFTSHPENLDEEYDEDDDQGTTYSEPFTTYPESLYDEDEITPKKRRHFDREASDVRSSHVSI